MNKTLIYRFIGCIILAVALILVLITVFISFAVGAKAQNAPCQTREQVLATITAEDPVHQVWQALDVQDDVIEVWANLETDEWIMIVTKPTDVSCPVSSGEAFRLTQPMSEE